MNIVIKSFILNLIYLSYIPTQCISLEPKDISEFEQIEENTIGEIRQLLKDDEIYKKNQNNLVRDLLLALYNQPDIIAELLQRSYLNKNKVNNIMPFDMILNDEIAQNINFIFEGYDDLEELTVNNRAEKVNKTFLFITALKNNNVFEAKKLLALGIDVNVKDDYGYTALHWATIKGYKEIVQLLINSKSNVNVTDFDNRTPLHYAADKGDAEIVKILLSYNANVNVKDLNGSTPLYWARLAGRKEVVDILIKATHKF